MKILTASLVVTGAIALTVFVAGGHAAHVAAVLNPIKPAANAQAAFFFDPNAPVRVAPGDQPCSCTLCCSVPS